MNRRRFFGLLAAAPVAIAAAPIVAAELPELARCAGIKIGETIRVKKPILFKELSDAEMEERYFRPAAEAIHNRMLKDMAAGKFDQLFYRPPGATS